MPDVNLNSSDAWFSRLDQKMDALRESHDRLREETRSAFDVHRADDDKAFQRCHERIDQTNTHLEATDKNVTSLEKEGAVSKVKMGLIGTFFSVVGAALVEGWTHLFGGK